MIVSRQGAPCGAATRHPASRSFSDITGRTGPETAGLPSPGVVPLLPLGRDWGPAVSWVVAAGVLESNVLAAWRAGRAVRVPTGRVWDVVRVVDQTGQAALARLAAGHVPVGPVLTVPARRTVEFLVSPGTWRSWPLGLTGVVCPGPGSASRLPAPDRTHAGAARCGRRWLSPPRPRQPFTDADVLCEVLAAAVAHRTREWSRAWEGFDRPPERSGR
jgi:hypothetical protein